MCSLCWEHEQVARWLCIRCRRTDVWGVCRNCPAEPVQQQQQQQAHMEKRSAKPSLAAGLATSTVTPELVIEDKGKLPNMCKKYSGW